MKEAHTASPMGKNWPKRHHTRYAQCTQRQEISAIVSPVTPDLRRGPYNVCSLATSGAKDSPQLDTAVQSVYSQCTVSVQSAYSQCTVSVLAVPEPVRKSDAPVSIQSAYSHNTVSVQSVYSQCTVSVLAVPEPGRPHSPGAAVQSVYSQCTVSIQSVYSLRKASLTRCGWPVSSMAMTATEMVWVAAAAMAAAPTTAKLPGYTVPPSAASHPGDVTRVSPGCYKVYSPAALMLNSCGAEMGSCDAGPIDSGDLWDGDECARCEGQVQDKERRDGERGRPRSSGTPCTCSLQQRAHPTAQLGPRGRGAKQGLNGQLEP
eukprot:940072-Pyramimonas_sp.AAC.1